MEVIHQHLWDISAFTVFMQLLNLAALAGLGYLLFLLVRFLHKYRKNGAKRMERTVVRKSLGEALKEHRTRCKMTQEFVAEHLNVSRQAVSKWETGSSEPSTANLLALAKLFGISPEELLKEIQP